MAQINATQLDDIDTLIRQENDPEKRNVLLILQSMTIGLIHVVDTIESIENKVKAKDILYTRKIEEYDTTLAKGRTIWRVLTVMYALLQAGIVGIAGYSYKTISEIRDMSYSNQIKLEMLQQDLTNTKNQAMITQQELSDMLKDHRLIDQNR